MIQNLVLCLELSQPGGKCCVSRSGEGQAVALEAKRDLYVLSRFETRLRAGESRSCDSFWAHKENTPTIDVDGFPENIPTGSAQQRLCNVWRLRVEGSNLMFIWGHGSSSAAQP